EAAQIMRERNIGDVIVESDERICGIVTDRDIVVRVVAYGTDPDTAKLDKLCTSDVIAISPDDKVDRAVALMREHVVRRLPVVDNGRPIGVVSLGDLAL